MEMNAMEPPEKKGSALVIYEEVDSMFIQDKDDRRDAVRINFIADVTVTVASDQRSIQGRLRNLCIDGMSLDTEAEVPAGTACTVEIVVKDRNSQLSINSIDAEVVRSSDETGEMALKFDHHFEWLALFHVYSSKSAKN